MAKGGAHPEKALTAVGVRNIKQPGRYADGNGLYLVVKPSGSKSWILRTVVQSKRRDFGLGSAKLVPLAEAREKATEMRKVAREGGDPTKGRANTKTDTPTFAEAARAVHEARGPTWKNAKHKAQWISTLERYAFPLIGDRRLDDIETSDIVKLLSPIWLTKVETAKRVRQRVHAVLDWARAHGHRDGENPVVGVQRGLAKQSKKVAHLTAMPYRSVPAFFQNVDHFSAAEAVRGALRFTILTSARTNETLFASWAEIDLDDRVWVVPSERMKAGREHVVPLSQPAIDELLRARPFSGASEFVFPGRTRGRPLSNMAMISAMRRTGEAEATIHGFRSSFSDWCAEQTDFPREVVEASLSHSLKDRVEAAYRRTTLLDKRRQLMQAWADFVTSPKGEVVALASVTR
jgi:integrase